MHWQQGINRRYSALQVDRVDAQKERSHAVGRVDEHIVGAARQRNRQGDDVVIARAGTLQVASSKGRQEQADGDIETTKKGYRKIHASGANKNQARGPKGIL